MIIINNEDSLRVDCEDVTIEEYSDLLNKLELELSNANKLGKNGIGLAAPQIGIAKNIAIIRLPKIKLDLVKLIKVTTPLFLKRKGVCLFLVELKIL